MDSGDRAKWLNTGAYYIYGRNAASATPAVATQQFLGLTVTGDFGFLKYDFDAVAGQQNGGNNGAIRDRHCDRRRRSQQRPGLDG